jgi:hypothetical protein
MRTTERIVFASASVGVVVRVPAGFAVDGYSLPFGLLFSPWDKPEPAVIHDWLYTYPDGLTRKQCDDVFMDAMDAYYVSFVRRWAFYVAVRLFGRKSWNRCRADDLNEKFEIDRAIGKV